MSYLDKLPADPLPWLLERDPDNPGVRYFALRELLDRPEADPEVRQARHDVMTSGPVPAILDAQDEAGYWFKPGPGYSPKYRATVWQVIFLADLGTDPDDERVRRGCEYLLAHNPAPNGAFSYTSQTSSGAVHCINGNLIYALLRLGYAEDTRLGAALDWQARAVTGEGDVTYYKSGTAGPGFACGINLGGACGWGAVKALKALNAVPLEMRTPVIRQAIGASVEFLLSHDPAKADYPYTNRVSSTWFKFGFPLSYWSDVLENTAALVDAGHGDDPRLANALRLILDKGDSQGRWKLENDLNSKFWPDLEKRGGPSKWITLRVLRVLKRLG